MGKSKIKPFIIAGCILLVIGLIIGIYFYVTTDFLKAPKTLFIKYFSNVSSMFDIQGLDVIDKVDEYTKENNYKETGVTSIDLFKLLSNSEGANTEYVLKTEFEKDVSNNKIRIPLSLTYKNHELMRGEALINNDLYGLNIDGLTERPIAVKNNNLKEVAKKLGVENNQKIPNTFKKIDITNVNIAEDLNVIFSKYIQSVNDTFDKDSFSKERSVEVILEEQKYKANRFTLTMSLNEFYVFIKDTAEKMKQDDALKSFMLENFGITNATVEEFLNNTVIKSDEILSLYDSNSEMNIFLYEKDGNLLKIEVKASNLSYEIYAFKADNYYKFFYYFDSIETNSRKTNENSKLIFENNFDDTSINISITYNGKKLVQEMDELNTTSSGYIENDFKLLYGLNNVNETSADRIFSLIINNDKLLEYKGKLTIGVNTDVESITSENSDVINDMSEENLRNLVSSLTQNAASFIDVSNISEEDYVEEPVLEDTGDIESAIKDLNSAFMKILANYNLDKEGAETLKDYFNEERLKNGLNFGNEILLHENKLVVLYRNRANMTFKFDLNITNYAIEITEYSKLENVESTTLNDIFYPPPEPEPEPEPEIVPNTDLLSVMKSEIESYLAAIYNEAVTTGEEIYAADYINEEQLIANCSTIVASYVEEQEGGTFYIECQDIENNVYSGVIQITDEGLNLLMFN